MRRVAVAWTHAVQRICRGHSSLRHARECAVARLGRTASIENSLGSPRFLNLAGFEQEICGMELSTQDDHSLEDEWMGLSFYRKRSDGQDGPDTYSMPNHLLSTGSAVVQEGTGRGDRRIHSSSGIMLNGVNYGVLNGCRTAAWLLFNPLGCYSIRLFPCASFDHRSVLRISVLLRAGVRSSQPMRRPHHSEFVGV